MAFLSLTPAASAVVTISWVTVGVSGTSDSTGTGGVPGSGGSTGTGLGAGLGGTRRAHFSPLPNDASIFGTDVMAMYIFRNPHVTTTGDPLVVTSVVNANAPGTHDVTFINPPLWIAREGLSQAGVLIVKDSSANKCGVIS